MPKYEIIIYWSQADEAFIAEVLELPGGWPHLNSEKRLWVALAFLFFARVGLLTLLSFALIS
jgi:hypothetical protein